jgi:8-oxo-dGTP pyrophosphatase MutT (NUDIX family)
MEPGETPLEAAVRELREETGLAGRFPAGLGVEGTPPGLLGYEEHLAGSKGLHMNLQLDLSSRKYGWLGDFGGVYGGLPVPSPEGRLVGWRS